MRIRELARRHPVVLQILRVHRLRERARCLFPDSEALQGQWVQTKLRMRQLCIRRPRVQIGRTEITTFPRTLREAGIQGDLS